MKTVSLNLLKSTRGFILYEGPSKLDGKTIVAIATLESKNEKTGNMIQTWILRKDKNPLSAVADGDDKSICGNCPHRGDNNGKGRSCYVSLHQAPRGVYSAYVNESYTKFDGTNPTHTNHFVGRTLRVGSYGDGAAVPYEVWEQILKLTKGHTGYTHQWRRRNLSSKFKNILMASCESEKDRLDAKKLGYRTFRIVSDVESLGEKEFFCPASAEEGYRKTCETCLACSGTRNGKIPNAADVAIVIHGNKVKLNNYARRKT